jgi:cell division septation protein DedD
VPITQLAPLPLGQAASNPSQASVSTVPTQSEAGLPAINNSQEVVIVYGGNTSYSDSTGRIITVGPNNVVTNTPSISKPEKTDTATATSTANPALSTSGQVNATSNASNTTVANEKTTQIAGKPESQPSTDPTKIAQASSDTSGKTIKVSQGSNEVKTTTGTSDNKVVSAGASIQTNTRGREYWIQVLSSPNRDRVENLKKGLATRGWAGRITVKNLNGIDYYRLRYGPFNQSDEANKFLGFVKAVKGLESSYTVEEYPIIAKK